MTVAHQKFWHGFAQPQKTQNWPWPTKIFRMSMAHQKDHEKTMFHQKLWKDCVQPQKPENDSGPPKSLEWLCPTTNAWKMTVAHQKFWNDCPTTKAWKWPWPTKIFRMTVAHPKDHETTVSHQMFWNDCVQPQKTENDPGPPNLLEWLWPTKDFWNV